MDIRAFAVGSLRALSDPPVTKTSQLTNVHTEKSSSKSKQPSQKNGQIAPKNHIPVKSPIKAAPLARPAPSSTEMKDPAQKENDSTPTVSAEPSFVAPRRQRPTVSPKKVPIAAPVPAPTVEQKVPARHDSDSDDEMPSLAMLPTGPLRIAGMGGVVVVGTTPTHRSPLHQQPPQQQQQQQLSKGHLHNTPKASAVAFSPSLSAEGLQGTSAFPARATTHTQAVKQKGNPPRVEKPLVLDDDDVSDEEQFGSEGASAPTAAVSLKIQGNQAHKALKITIPQQSSSITQSRLAPTKTPVAVAQAPPMQLVDDPVVVEAQLAGVRSIKVNEVASKQSAQKLLEQLKAKRESRA